MTKGTNNHSEGWPANEVSVNADLQSLELSPRSGKAEGPSAGNDLTSQTSKSPPLCDTDVEVEVEEHTGGRDYQRWEVPPGPFSPPTTPATSPTRSALKPTGTFSARFGTRCKRSVNASFEGFPAPIPRVPRINPRAPATEADIERKRLRLEEERLIEEEDSFFEEPLNAWNYMLDGEDVARNRGHILDHAELVRRANIPRSDFHVVINAPQTWTVPKSLAIFDCDIFDDTIEAYGQAAAEKATSSILEGVKADLETKRESIEKEAERRVLKRLKDTLEDITAGGALEKEIADKIAASMELSLEDGEQL